MSPYTSFLFNEPSFLEGMARAADFGDLLSVYNVSTSPAEADFNALFSDWCAVAEDLRQVIEQHVEQESKKPAAKIAAV